MVQPFLREDTRPTRRAQPGWIRDRLVAGVAILALLMMSDPAVARTVFPVSGGSGDAAFEDHCPANEYLTGLAGRTGLWVDRIAVICSQVLPNGTHGTSYYGPAHGGNGGAALEFSCSADSVVTGVVLSLDDTNRRVTRVELVCTSLQAARQATVSFGGGEPSSTLNLREPQACPNGEVATGFAGRYGRDLNALGLLCDARTTAVVPAPAASQYPIRQTGKAAPTPAPADASTTALACPQGFVWREASPTDHVCVTPAQRRIAAEENTTAAERVSQTDHSYGPNTCVQGYVWREAYSGDVVCVTPQQRHDAAEQNRIAPALVPAATP